MVPEFEAEFDDRYVNLGLETNEYDVQLMSGVLFDLRALPMSQTYVEMGAKRERKYYTWGRATIPYTLECERRMSRSEFLDKIVSLNLEVGSYDKTVAIQRILLILFFVFLAVNFILNLHGLCELVDESS